MKMEKGETVSEYIKRLLTMVDRRKRDEMYIREWKGLPKRELKKRKEEDPAPKKSGREFHSPDRNKL